MIEPAAAAMLAIGVDEAGAAEGGPDIAERLMVLGEKLGASLDGTYEGDVCSILEALYERIVDIEGSIRRLEDRP